MGRSNSESGSVSSGSDSRSSSPKERENKTPITQKASDSDCSTSETPRKSRSRSRSQLGSPLSKLDSSSQHSATRSNSPNSPNSKASSKEHRESVDSLESHSVNSSRSSLHKPSATDKSGIQEAYFEENSQSPNLQIDDDHSNTGSSSDDHDLPTTKKKRKSRSRTRSRSGSSSNSRSGARLKSKSRSRSVTPQSNKSNSGSDSDIGVKRKPPISGPDEEQSDNIKRSRIVDSESEDERREPTPDAKDIFGEISGSEEEQETKTNNEHSNRSPPHSVSRTFSQSGESGSRSRSGSNARSRSRSPLIASKTQVAASDEEPDAPPEIIEVNIPRIAMDLGREVHFFKLPNFLSIDTHPFDPETYEDEIDEEETMDEEGRQRIKLKVSNTIRWREYINDNGDIVRESNTRIVKWSDGSMTLQLGNEGFDAYKTPFQGDHNHLFIRQGTGLQGQSVFRTKLTFRPYSTESFTHKKMTMSLADRSQKTSGIKILTQVGKDPTADRLFNLKKEEEKLRQAMRTQHKPQPKKKKANHHDSHVTANAYNNDEGSDDENAISLSAIKNKYKKGIKSNKEKSNTVYTTDEDDGSDFEGRRSKKLDKTKVVKALRDSDSDSDKGKDATVGDSKEVVNESSNNEDDLSSNDDGGGSSAENDSAIHANKRRESDNDD